MHDEEEGIVRARVLVGHSVTFNHRVILAGLTRLRGEGGALVFDRPATQPLS